MIVNRGLIYEKVQSFSCLGCCFCFEEENVCTAPDDMPSCANINPEEVSFIYKLVGEVEQ